MPLVKRLVMLIGMARVFIAITNAQIVDMNKPVTLKLESVSLSQALESVRKTTGIFFAYTGNISNVKKTIDINAENIPVGELLNEIFDGTGYSYIVYQNQVIIRLNPLQPRNLTLQGIVMDAENLQPISYATVALINKQTGTISDINGQFELRLNKDELSDTIAFSSVGYQQVKYTVETYLGGSVKMVKLPVRTIPIDPVIVKPDPGKLIRLGNRKNRPAGSMYLDTHGQQTALYLENDKKEEGRIKSIDYYLSDEGNTDAPFRVHIYEVDSVTGKPGKDLIPGILVAKPSNVSGWFAVDVWQYNIQIPPRGLFVAMEGIFPNDYEFYNQEDDFVDLTKGSVEISDSNTVETINYGEKLGYTRNKKGKNFTWLYSLDHRWFQLKKQNMGIMVSAEIILNKKK